MFEPLMILLQFLGTVLAVIAGIAVFAIIGLMLVLNSLRNIRVPPDADFFTTMHYVPITLVILLDLLDLSLDIFSAPIAWFFLDRQGLSSLRNTAALQAVVPLTGPVPVLTISWLLARSLNLGGVVGPYPAERPARRYLDGPSSGYDQYDQYDRAGRPRRRRQPDIIDADEL